ncbi:hypothetical protein [Rheinheimera aquimaris]|uniref:hypothetical protein n=1 Tax=Rheinheimera aquimaris TaxID=412437 RepID=UPI003A96E6EB
MRILIFALFFIQTNLFADDAKIAAPPISIQLQSDCGAKICNLTLCINNNKDEDITITSPFLDEGHPVVNGVYLYPLDDYIRTGSDIYSPRLRKEKVTESFKEDYLKRIESSTELSFGFGEKKFSTLEIEKYYILDSNRYYIGNYILKDSYIIGNDGNSFFPLALMLSS